MSLPGLLDMPQTRMEPASIDARTFRRTCANFATGVTVAAVLDERGQPHGLTVNSFTSVSCTPPMVLICVDHRSSVLPHFRLDGHFGICVLCECQRDISVRFAARHPNKFDGLAWRVTDMNVPLLEKSLAAFECRVQQCVEAGDHMIVIGEVLRAEHRSGRPLLYYASDYARIQHSLDHVAVQSA